MFEKPRKAQVVRIKIEAVWVLRKDRTLQSLVTDLVAARAAAGVTQQEVAIRMWTTKSAVS